MRPPRGRTAMLGLTLVGLGVRLYHLTSQNLWLDEVETARIAVTPLADLVQRAQHDPTLLPTAWLSPVYYLLLHGALAVMPGSVEGVVRGVSAVLGAATIPALAWAASGLVGEPVALGAAAVMAVSPFHVWYSQEARPYAALLFFGTLAAGALRRALDADRVAGWAGFVACAVLAIYMHPIAVALPLLAALGLLWRRTYPPWRALAALAAVVLLLVPAVVLLAAKGPNLQTNMRPITLLDPLYGLYAFAVGFSLGPSTAELHGSFRELLPMYAPIVLAAAVLFGGVLAAGFVALLRTPRATVAFLLAWFALPFLLALALAAATHDAFNARYTILAYPVFAITLAAGVGHLADLFATAVVRPAARRTAAAAVAMAIVAMSGWSLYNLQTDPRYAKEACRDLGAYLAANASPEDVVLVNAGYMAAAVQYYYPDGARVVGYPRAGPMPSAEQARSDLSALVAGRSRVWLVLTRTFHGDRDGLLRRLLAETFREDREQRFPGVVVYCYSLPTEHDVADQRVNPSAWLASARSVTANRRPPHSRGGLRDRTGQQSLDRADELTRRERLAQERIGAETPDEALDLGLLAVGDCDDARWLCGPGRPESATQPAQHLKPVHPRQAQLQHHHRNVFGSHQLTRFRSICGEADIDPA
jgi:mannosyltransferase